MNDTLIDRRDIDFVLYEQLDIATLTGMERFAHLSREEFDMVLEQAIKFSRNDLVPTNADGDQIGAQWKDGQVTLPDSFHGPLQKYAEQGWVASIDEPEVGGQGLPLSIFNAACEAFIAGNMALSQYMTLTHGTALLVKLFGTEDQKARYMDKLLSFEWAGTMCLTEPGAGSDLARIVTKAEKIDDRYYKISGQKIFITAGDHNGKPNIVHAVLARVDGDPVGIKGISIFIVPKHRVKQDGSLDIPNDVQCSGIEHKMGIKGSATSSLNFGEKGECIGELLGERCQGISIMFHMMNEERLLVAMQALALAGTAYLHALEYAKERIQGSDITNKGRNAQPVAIIKHPDVQRSFIWMKSYIEGMRALNYYTAYCIDMRNASIDSEQKKKLNGMVELLTPICKAYTSDMGFQVCNAAIQVLGGYGYCRDYPLEQYARDCRITGIYEGTNGIQAIDLLARKLPMDDGNIFKTLIQKIELTIDEASKEESLAGLASSFRHAKIQMLETISYLNTLMSKGKISDAFMQATPLMEIVGDTLLGWMHLWQACIAQEKLTLLFKTKKAETQQQQADLIQEDTEASFYNEKIRTARFFITRILPITLGKVIAVCNEDPAVPEMHQINFR